MTAASDVVRNDTWRYVSAGNLLPFCGRACSTTPGSRQNAPDTAASPEFYFDETVKSKSDCMNSVRILIDDLDIYTI